MDIMTVLPWLTAANTLLVIGGFLWASRPRAARRLKRIGELGRRSPRQSRVHEVAGHLGQAVAYALSPLWTASCDDRAARHLPTASRRIGSTGRGGCPVIDVLAEEIEPVGDRDRWRELILEQAKK